MRVKRFEEYWRPGWEGAKANFKPGLIVQGLILLMVVSYYSVPVIHHTLEQITGMRHATGIVSSFLIAAVMAGLVSEFLKWLTTPPLRMDPPERGNTTVSTFFSGGATA
ncbi:hypothetical protein QPK87_27575 [Kamptonema cortianum]|nr:hypothetical protein [Kamptonema cortianum]